MSMGEKMARVAVAERLVPICVSQFNQDPQREENFYTLKGKSSWSRKNISRHRDGQPFRLRKRLMVWLRLNVLN